MVDKLRKTFPIKITFSDGELPTSGKLTAMSNQIRNGMAIIEKAVGDLWNQSGDETLNQHPLQIPNLARVVGQQEYMNPAMYPLDQKVQYTDYLPDSTGKTEGYLTFVPDTLTSLTSLGAPFITRVTNETDVDATGEYWVDGATGRFRSYDKVTGATFIRYDVDTSDWIAGDFEVVPCIIPDPRQTEFTNCRISTSAGKFYLHLPPRRPLLLSGFENPARYPLIDDSFNEATVGGAPYKMWQRMDVNAIADRHYRYPWPKEIRDIITGLSEGDALPQSFMYVWDDVEQTIIEDVIFRKGPQDWIVEISSASLDFSPDVTANESEASYSNSRYRLIVAGAPLARSLWVARNATLTSKHTNQGDLTPTLQHGTLFAQNPPPNQGANYPNYLPPWLASKWEDDDHTYLLSRAGSHTTGAETRDKWNNAMLGHLLIANADTSGADNYLDATLPNGSFQIFFGNVTSSLYLQGVNNTSLELQGASATHFQLNSAASLQASVKFHDNDVPKWQIGKQTDNNFFIWDHANAKDMLRIRSSPSDIQLVPVSGNVGVGSITPVNKLDVSGAMAVGAAYAGVNTAPANGMIIQGTVGIGTNTPGTSTLAVWNTTSPIFHMRRDGSNEWFVTATPVGTDRLGFRAGSNVDAQERLTLLTGGNVGIGTIAPVQLLEVSGTSTQKLRLTHTSVGGESLSLGNGTAASTFLFSNTGELWIGGVADVNTSPSSTDADITITTAGRVGIQEPSPLFDLQVGTSQPDVLLKATSGSGTSVHLRTDGTNSFVNNMDNFVTNGSAGNGLLIFTGQTGISLRQGSAGSSGTEALRIYNSAGLFDFFGPNSTSIRLDMTTSDSGFTGTWFMGSGGDPYMKIGHNSSGRGFKLQTNSLDRITIESGGFVGVGMAPPKRLSVADSILVRNSSFLCGVQIRAVNNFLVQISSAANYDTNGNTLQGNLDITGGDALSLGITNSSGVSRTGLFLAMDTTGVFAKSTVVCGNGSIGIQRGVGDPRPALHIQGVARGGSLAPLHMAHPGIGYKSQTFTVSTPTTSTHTVMRGIVPFRDNLVYTSGTTGGVALVHQHDNEDESVTHINSYTLTGSSPSNPVIMGNYAYAVTDDGANIRISKVNLETGGVFSTTVTAATGTVGEYWLTSDTTFVYVIYEQPASDVTVAKITHVNTDTAPTVGFSTAYTTPVIGSILGAVHDGTFLYWVSSTGTPTGTGTVTLSRIDANIEVAAAPVAGVTTIDTSPVATIESTSVGLVTDGTMIFYGYGDNTDQYYRSYITPPGTTTTTAIRSFNFNHGDVPMKLVAVDEHWLWLSHSTTAYIALIAKDLSVDATDTTLGLIPPSAAAASVSKWRGQILCLDGAMVYSVYDGGAVNLVLHRGGRP